jgi:pyridoxal phosphate enzyme (YggS family)
VYIAQNLNNILKQLPTHVTLVAVSKTKSVADIKEAYDAGQRDFGENKVQEMTSKHEDLPSDIRWHMIGHLQSNKIKYMAAYVHLIHGVDSLDLLIEINKHAIKHNRIIPCLLQVYIAQEETKFGLDFNEIETLLQSETFSNLQNIKVVGLMGMASFTDDESQIKSEFHSLNLFFQKLKISQPETTNLKLETLSMGMSGDYQIAIEEGSNLVRIGSAIFGSRNYIA